MGKRPLSLWLVGVITAITAVPALVSGQGDPATPSPVSGRALEPVREVTLSDVLARVELLQDELELIRRTLGKPQNTQREVEVANVTLREVLFQARTLVDKADRLCLEQAQRRGLEPRMPPTEAIQPTHIWTLVDTALQRLVIVKEHLGISEPVEERAQSATVRPTEVYRSLVQVNRQVNLLLEREVSPSDVFQQVTLAVSYAARLRASFPGRRMPAAPPLVDDQQPVEIYQLLLSCHTLLGQIAHRSGLTMLDLKEPTQSHAALRDVSDLASLVVAELAYLHAALGQAKPPRDSYYPGPKTPSEVSARAQLLKAQLLDLKALVDQQPDWLQPERG